MVFMSSKEFQLLEHRAIGIVLLVVAASARFAKAPAVSP